MAEQCGKILYGSGRVFGGERCSNKAKGEYNGKWLCGIHSPEAAAKRGAKREERYQERVRQSKVRGDRHRYKAACVNAFHSPSRTIATENIPEGVVFRLHDALNWLMSRGAILSVLEDDEIEANRKLLASLKVEQSDG